MTTADSREVKVFTYEDIPILHPPAEKPHFAVGDIVFVKSLYECPIRMEGVIIKAGYQYLVEFPNEARWWFWPGSMEKV